MASLDEFNPGRWEAEDEDFLDREDNYVLQKSTNTMVTNVPAKTREQRIRSTRFSKRQPPSFAGGKSLHKTHSSKKPISSSSRDTTKHIHKSSSNHNGTFQPSLSKQPSPSSSTAVRDPSKEPSQKSFSSKSSLRRPSSSASHTSLTQKQQQQQQSCSHKKRLSKENNSNKDDHSDEDSLRIEEIFPILTEPSPPTTDDAHWKSQPIFIPTKQEKWNEQSVMRMHQSMFSVHREESPYMKDIHFDDDDKSLTIEDVFPVLKTGTKATTSAVPPKPSGPAILQAAKKAQANKRWRTAGQKIAATRTSSRETTAASTLKPPAPVQPAPVVPSTTQQASPVHTTTTTTTPTLTVKQAPVDTKPPSPPAPSSTKPPPAPNPPLAKKAPVYEETEDVAKKRYPLPTYVKKPSQSENLHGSDGDLTMDSALMNSSSNHNLQEQEERAAATVEPEPKHVQESLNQPDAHISEEQDRLERKKSKRSKKESKSQKKDKKHKKSSRRLREEDYATLSQTELDQDGPGHESLMDSEEAEQARRRLRKQERRERKEQKKAKKQKRSTQSERNLPTQSRAAAEEVRLARSLPEMEESPSTSPTDSMPQKTMSESQPAISSSKLPALESYLSNREETRERRKSSRRFLQSEDSSKRSDGKLSTKSDGHIARTKSLRQRNEDYNDGSELDTNIGHDKKKAISTMSASKLSVQCDSPATVKKSNVVGKRGPQPPHKGGVPKIATNEFMKSAAAGMLHESDEDSWSPGAVAAVRSRMQAARAESRRMTTSSDLKSRTSNTALQSKVPSKEPLDKNKQSPTSIKSSTSGRLPSTRPDLMDNERMNSIGNFDMVSAVDAAVAAKKQGKLPTVGTKKKRKEIWKRLLGRNQVKA